jgi:sugar fermentation stimulation protein A
MLVTQLSKNAMTKITTLEGLKKYTVVRRENRFVVTVRNDQRIKRALLRNTGRLYDMIQNGYTALCIDRSKGRTDCNIIGVLVDDERAAIIDPFTQARVFELAVNNKLIPWLTDWHLRKREVTVGESRLDYLIADGTDEGYIELKSAAYCDGYYAMYPDCPSERGLRHITTLEHLNTSGYRTIIAFVAAHPNAKAFKPNMHAHEQLASKLSSAHKKGVEVYAIKIFLDTYGNIFLADPNLPVEL